MSDMDAVFDCQDFFVKAKAENGAVAAYRNFTKAQSEADFALSLYNDATHSGITWFRNEKVILFND